MHTFLQIPGTHGAQTVTPATERTARSVPQMGVLPVVAVRKARPSAAFQRRIYPTPRPFDEQPAPTTPRERILGAEPSLGIHRRQRAPPSSWLRRIRSIVQPPPGTPRRRAEITHARQSCDGGPRLRGVRTYGGSCAELNVGRRRPRWSAGHDVAPVAASSLRTLPRTIRGAQSGRPTARCGSGRTVYGSQVTGTMYAAAQCRGVLSVVTPEQRRGHQTRFRRALSEPPRRLRAFPGDSPSVPHPRCCPRSPISPAARTKLRGASHAAPLMQNRGDSWSVGASCGAGGQRTRLSRTRCGGASMHWARHPRRRLPIALSARALCRSRQPRRAPALLRPAVAAIRRKDSAAQVGVPWHPARNTSLAAIFRGPPRKCLRDQARRAHADAQLRAGAPVRDAPAAPSALGECARKEESRCRSHPSVVSGTRSARGRPCAAAGHISVGAACAPAWAMLEVRMSVGLRAHPPASCMPEEPAHPLLCLARCTVTTPAATTRGAPYI